MANAIYLDAALPTTSLKAGMEDIRDSLVELTSAFSDAMKESIQVNKDCSFRGEHKIPEHCSGISVGLIVPSDGTDDILDDIKTRIKAIGGHILESSSVFNPFMNSDDTQVEPLKSDPNAPPVGPSGAIVRRAPAHMR